MENGEEGENGHVLEKLPENRAERCGQLLKNLPNEDLVHIMKAKIPVFLRIDKDVIAKQEYLKSFYTKYQQFDIEDLKKSVQAKLQKSIDDASHDFIAHKESVTAMLVKGEETNRNSDQL